MIERIPIAAGRFQGQRMADGRVWVRVCESCGRQQADDTQVNVPCQFCGCSVVKWIPRREDAVAERRWN